jgi:phospholipid/cholesterol/gamma-HCH transport system substrate-binding protein
LSIKTKGLIGEKYIELTPGASDNRIKAGGVIRDTQPAMDLEALIGKYIQGTLAKPDDKGQPPR